MSARVGASRVLGTQTHERKLPLRIRTVSALLRDPKLSPWSPAVRGGRILGGLIEAFTGAYSARRVFVLLPFAMIAGMMVYAVLPFEPSPIALGIVVLVLLVCVWMVIDRDWLPLVIVLAAFWSGLCLLPLHGAAFGTAMLARPAYGAFQAKVDEVLSSTPDGQRVVISNLTPLGGERPVNINKARVVLPVAPHLLPGDNIAGTFRLVPVPGPILPGAFDGQFQSYFSGIGAYGTLTGELFLSLTPKSSI